MNCYSLVTPVICIEKYTDRHVRQNMKKKMKKKRISRERKGNTIDETVNCHFLVVQVNIID